MPKLTIAKKNCDPVTVMQWGLGAMGSGMAELALSKKNMKLVSAWKKRPEGQGKDLSEILGNSEPTGVIVASDPFEEIKRTKPDVVMMASCSTVKESFEDILKVIDLGCNVVTIAEEMAYPWAMEPELSDKIDRAAKEKGVSVIGTGINPGFILDALVIMMTGCCRNITNVEASRVNDLSPFGPTVMKSQGVGTTPEEFQKGIEDGTIVGHIGFPQSIAMIAEAAGIEVDTYEETREPIITNTYRETKYIKVEPGMVAGCKHIGYGLKDGKKLITLIHPQQILPETEGTSTGDYIKIEGDPGCNVSNQPECPGGIGTMAVAVNCVPFMKDAKPGMLTMLDLPLLRIAV